MDKLIYFCSVWSSDGGPRQDVCARGAATRVQRAHCTPGRHHHTKPVWGWVSTALYSKLPLSACTYYISTTTPAVIFPWLMFGVSSNCLLGRLSAMKMGLYLLVLYLVFPQTAEWTEDQQWEWGWAGDGVVPSAGCQDRSPLVHRPRPGGRTHRHGIIHCKLVYKSYKSGW